jgi:riboflavin synthase
MFTGIVEEMGAVDAVVDDGDSLRIRSAASGVVADATHGASISVNGTCLTVAEHGTAWFEADVMRETLERTGLRTLAVGDRVNLERAARLDSRLGGHIVQGHVDGVGTIAGIHPGDRWTLVEVAVPSELTRYMVEKGSVTVDGVSLTIVAVLDEGFTVSLIPTTLAETTLGTRNVGDAVNIEVDVLAKYVEKLVSR